MSAYGNPSSSRLLRSSASITGGDRHAVQPAPEGFASSALFVSHSFAGNEEWGYCTSIVEGAFVGTAIGGLLAPFFEECVVGCSAWEKAKAKDGGLQ